MTSQEVFVLQYLAFQPHLEMPSCTSDPCCVTCILCSRSPASSGSPASVTSDMLPLPGSTNQHARKPSAGVHGGRTPRPHFFLWLPDRTGEVSWRYPRLAPVRSLYDGVTSEMVGEVALILPRFALAEVLPETQLKFSMGHRVLHRGNTS